jgi:hypothetical protein
MKITNKSKRQFQCRDGEEITVTVRSKDTVFLVTYRLDQETGHLDEGEPLVFDLNESEANPTFLTLGFHFSGSNGGAYSIRITGDPSGDTFKDAYSQDHVPVVFDHFTFNI